MEAIKQPTKLQQNAIAMRDRFAKAEPMLQRLKYINDNKFDVVVPTDSMVLLNDRRFAFRHDNQNHFVNLNPFAQRKLATYCEVPTQYFERILLENPQLAADSINHGLAKASQKGESRLLRNLDGNLRSVLSSRYFVCDGYDIMNRILPLLDARGFRVTEAQVTESKIYLNVVSDVFTTDVQKGDVVSFGITIQTSDLGNGSISIELYAHRAVCDNGLILPSSVKRRHTGKELDNEYLSESTMSKETEAFLSRTYDNVSGLLNETNFRREMARLEQSTKLEISQPLTSAERAAKILGITSQGIVDRATDLLVKGNQGAGMTQWGLINSFTAAAKEVKDFDQRTEIERAAGQILTLSPKQWSHVAGNDTNEVTH